MSTSQSNQLNKCKHTNNNKKEEKKERPEFAFMRAVPSRVKPCRRERVKKGGRDRGSGYVPPARRGPQQAEGRLEDLSIECRESEEGLS